MASLEPPQDKIEEDAIAADKLPSEMPAAVEDTSPEPRQPASKKRKWIETLLLCIALFFPLFLATLDTSNLHPLRHSLPRPVLIEQPLLRPPYHVARRACANHADAL